MLNEFSCFLKESTELRCSSRAWGVVRPQNVCFLRKHQSKQKYCVTSFMSHNHRHGYAGFCWDGVAAKRGEPQTFLNHNHVWRVRETEARAKSSTPSLSLMCTHRKSFFKSELLPSLYILTCCHFFKHFKLLYINTTVTAQIWIICLH